MKRLHVVAALALIAVFAFDSWALPLLPAGVFRFLERAFVLSGWTQIVVFNDLFALFSVLYFVALFGIVEALVIPREEGYLALLLAKPISRGRYLRMRLLPVYAALLAQGVALSGVLTAKLAWINGLDGLSVTSVLAMGVAAMLLAMGLCGLATLVCLIAHDTYTAVLASFLLFAALVIPARGYIYRPDLYVGHPLAANVLVFPANVIWAHASLPSRLPVFVIAALTTMALGSFASIAWLKRTDVE